MLQICELLEMVDPFEKIFRATTVEHRHLLGYDFFGCVLLLVIRAYCDGVRETTLLVAFLRRVAHG